MADIRQSDLVVALDPWNGATYNRHRSALLHFWEYCRQREYASLDVRGPDRDHAGLLARRRTITRYVPALLVENLSN